MANKEYIKFLAEHFLNNDFITESELRNNNCNKEDLLKMDILKKCDNGFTLKKIDILYNYSKRYITNKNSGKVMEYMDRCYELGYKEPKTNFDKFIKLIYEKKYIESLEYIDLFLLGDKEVKINDAKMYLYLLSFLVKLPDKYSNLYRNYTFGDFEVKSDNQLDNFNRANEVRLSISNNKFLLALHKIEAVEIRRDNFGRHNYVVRKMVNSIFLKEIERKQIIKNLFYAERYNEIINVLNFENKMHTISMFDVYTILLCEEIIRLQKEKQIKPKKEIETDNVFAAIDACDYELALKNSIDYANNNKQKSKNMLNVLLEKIVKIEKNIILNQPPEQTLKDNFEIEKIVNKVIESEEFVLLKPMKQTRIDSIKNKLSKDLSIQCVQLGNRLMIKYRFLNNSYFDHKAFLYDANRDYDNGNYRECLRKLKHFANVTKEPKGVIFFKIGMCYYKLYMKKNAIEYLTAAQLLNELEQNGKDLTELINHIKGQSTEEHDPKAVIRSSVFDEIDQYYGLRYKDQVINLLIEQHYSLDEVADEFKLTNEELNIIRLIVARNLYTESRDREADVIVSKVQKSEFKNDGVKRFLKDINLNKKFYKNRKSDDGEKLLLSLK